MGGGSRVYPHASAFIDGGLQIAIPVTDRAGLHGDTGIEHISARPVNLLNMDWSRVLVLSSPLDVQPKVDATLNSKQLATIFTGGICATRPRFVDTNLGNLQRAPVVC